MINKKKFQIRKDFLLILEIKGEEGIVHAVPVPAACWEPIWGSPWRPTTFWEEGELRMKRLNILFLCGAIARCRKIKLEIFPGNYS